METGVEFSLRCCVVCMVHCAVQCCLIQRFLTSNQTKPTVLPDAPVTETSPYGEGESLTFALEALNRNLDSSAIEEDLQELASVTARGRQTFTFLEEDEEFQKVLAQGGANPSARVDKWALNRLNSFRQFKGLDASVPFFNLPSPEIKALLCKFFEQVCKLDGKLYPPQTLMSLYRAFHRTMCRNQDVRVQETGVNEMPLSLKDSPIFKMIGVACVQSMKRSRNAGANMPRKKASVISLANEAIILKSPCTAPWNARGLQKRAAFYLLSRFCIRGGAELYELCASDFMFGEDASGKYVRYDERLSKNYKVSMQRYQEEHFRVAVTEYTFDVYHTLVHLIKRLPVSVPSGSKHLFYQPIDSPRTLAWYTTSRVAMRNLSKWLKIIHLESGLMGEGITNKSGRTMCVTRMSVEGVPAAVGMLITGHKNAGAYSRYDRSKEATVRAAQNVVATGTAYTENMVQETTKFKTHTVKGVGGAMADNTEKCASPDVDASEPAEVKCNLTPAIVPIIPKATETSSEEYESVVTQNTGKAEKKRRFGDQLSVQSTEEYDHWANAIDWEHVDKDLASKGVFVGKHVTSNPISAGRHSLIMSQCHNVTITFANGKFGPSENSVTDL